jgi:hypothetical protein
MRQPWPPQSKNGFGDLFARVTAISTHLDPLLSVPASKRVWLYLVVQYEHAFSQMSKQKFTTKVHILLSFIGKVMVRRLHPAWGSVNRRVLLCISTLLIPGNGFDIKMISS